MKRNTTTAVGKVVGRRNDRVKVDPETLVALVSSVWQMVVLKNELCRSPAAEVNPEEILEEENPVDIVDHDEVLLETVGRFTPRNTELIVHDLWGNVQPPFFEVPDDSLESAEIVIR